MQLKINIKDDDGVFKQDYYLHILYNSYFVYILASPPADKQHSNTY